MLFQDFFLDFVHTIKGWGIKKTQYWTLLTCTVWIKNKQKAPRHSSKYIFETRTGYEGK